MSAQPVTTSGIRPIAGYEGFYSISCDGQIWSHPKTLRDGRIKPGRWLTQCKTKGGYPTVVLCVAQVKKTFLVHRLVAVAFVENPNNLPECNHKNGIKSDNNYTNLEWCTSSSNKRHAWRAGLVKQTAARLRAVRQNAKAQSKKQRKLTFAQAQNARARAAKGDNASAIAKDLNVSSSIIRDIIANRTYTYE